MTIHPHPTAIAASLKQSRWHYLQEAARFAAKGDERNRHYCQGRASGLDEAIVLLGGEGIDLSLAQFGEVV